MKALRLMTSHHYYYKKLDEYGKDHDAEILKKVENEGKRLTAKHQRICKNEDKKNMDTVELSTDVSKNGEMTTSQCNSEGTTANDSNKSKDAAATSVRILESLKALCERNESSVQSSLLVFPQRKEKDSGETNINDNCGEEISSSEPQILSNVTDEDFLPDKGRKITLDNIDIRQETHDMTEDHQNPDAHYCGHMST